VPPDQHPSGADKKKKDERTRAPVKPISKTNPTAFVMHVGHLPELMWHRPSHAVQRTLATIYVNEETTFEPLNHASQKPPYQGRMNTARHP
jgi:hypothetical protein